jgi:protocatechuate 3,4-dioxygenase beta subunit
MAEAMGMAAGPAATTGPDGRFVLRGLEAGTVDLRVKAKDLAPALHKGVTVPAESEVRIALAEGASMEGTVYDAQRAPKSGAMVMLQRLPATMKMATTDAKGRYRIADVAPGNYIVYFMESADGMMNAGGGMNLKSESVTLEEGKTLVKDHRFGEGVRVTGRVTRGGKPVPNMMVMLIPGSGRKNATSAILGGGGFAMATTGEDGRYEITGLAPGVYTAMVQTGMGGGPAPGEPVEIAAGATEVRRDIVLSRNVVRGIVVDDAGKPVAQAQVVAIVTGRESARVADLGEAVASMGGQVMSGDDGRFSLEDVNPGSYTVKASAAGRSAAFAENVVPTEAGTEVRLVLAKGVDVTVRVVDAEGKPVSGAGIYLLRIGHLTLPLWRG